MGLPFSSLQYTDGWNANLSKETHAQVGDFPRKALTLHFYFAKLFISSHVFRGLTSDSRTDPIPPEFNQIATIAVESAKLIVNLIVQDTDIKAAFVGIPHYYHTMIAYACSFLLKIATKYRSHLDVDEQSIFRMIGEVVGLCKSSQCTRRHLVHWMGEGLQELLSKCSNATSQRLGSPQRPDFHDTTVDLGSADAPPAQYGQDPGSTSSTGQSLGHAWDAAREAAMLFPNSRNGPLYGESPLSTDQLGVVDGSTEHTALGFESLDPLWEESMIPFNFEHMGFGLL